MQDSDLIVKYENVMREKDELRKRCEQYDMQTAEMQKAAVDELVVRCFLKVMLTLHIPIRFQASLDPDLVNKCENLMRDNVELSKRCEQYNMQIAELQQTTAAAEQLVRYFRKLLTCRPDYFQSSPDPNLVEKCDNLTCENEVLSKRCEQYDALIAEMQTATAAVEQLVSFGFHSYEPCDHYF